MVGPSAAGPAKQALLVALGDPVAEVRITAAEVLVDLAGLGWVSEAPAQPLADDEIDRVVEAALGCVVAPETAVAAGRLLGGLGYRDPGGRVAAALRAALADRAVAPATFEGVWDHAAADVRLLLIDEAAAHGDAEVREAAARSLDAWSYVPPEAEPALLRAEEHIDLQLAGAARRARLAIRAPRTIER